MNGNLQNAVTVLGLTWAGITYTAPRRRERELKRNVKEARIIPNGMSGGFYFVLS